MEKPKEVEKKIANKRSLEEGSKEDEEEEKASKIEKEKPKRQASAETLNAISENLFIIQDIAKFISNPNIPNNKKGQYCVQLNAAIMGEAARQVIRLLEANEEYMPRNCKEMPWKTLIYIRTICSHTAHLQDLEQLVKAIRTDLPALEKMAAKMRLLIEKKQHEKKENEREPLKLVAIDAYSNAMKEMKKKKEAEKAKDESRQDKNIDKLSKQVKGLKIIVDEINNIKDFLKSGNDLVTLYAVQMSIVRSGLAVSDRLDQGFLEKHPLQINIPGRDPITWKSLITSRERTIHRNYKMDTEDTMKSSMALQGSIYFLQGLYEQQNANLTKLKTEFYQKLQAEKFLGSREPEQERTISSHSQSTTALAEAREPFKMSFTLKAPPKIKATGFIKPSALPSLPVSDTISPKQSSSSDVKEEYKAPSFGKKS